MKDSQYEISTDPSRLDIALIHEFLSSTYWAANIPRGVVEKSIRHSLCFGAFSRDRQVGFARVITDFATLAYLADVFVIAEHRGRGIAKMLTGAVLRHPDLQGVKRFLLATRDAHKLYAQFGFEPLAHPDYLMTFQPSNVAPGSGR